MTKLTSLQAITGALVAFGLSAAPAHALATRTHLGFRTRRRQRRLRARGAVPDVCLRAQPDSHGRRNRRARSGRLWRDDHHQGGQHRQRRGWHGGCLGGGERHRHHDQCPWGRRCRSPAWFDHRGIRRATTGIRLNSGASLAIVNCVVRHFNGTGILLAPAAAMSFLIVNTLVLDTLSTGDGILVDPQGNGSANGVIYHVVASQNGHAIYVRGVDSTGPINVTVVNSTLSGNNGDGVIAQSISGHSATAVMVQGCSTLYSESGKQQWITN
jgi:hypothetical protein